MQRDWTHDYFNDIYAEIYRKWLIPPQRTKTECAFVKKALRLDKNSLLLDVAAGYGRHAKLMSKFAKVHAIDAAPSYMRMAMEKSPSRLFCAVGDMRYLPYAGETFDALVLLFSSFGYFERLSSAEGGDQNLEMLFEFGRVLRSGGQMLLEVPNPYTLCEAVEENPHSIMTNGRFEVEEQFRIEEEGHVLGNRTVFRAHSIEQTVSYRLRLYDKTTVEKTLRGCGFKIVNVYGDYEGARYTRADSEIALFHCIKQG